MDSISDLIIRIKNGSSVQKDMVTIPYSKMKEEVLNVLEKEGYVKEVTVKGKKIHKSIEVGLVYDEFGPRVKGIERVSHLSKRIYSKAKDLKTINHGYGLTILTTPKGIMTDKDARQQKVGGELLFKVW